MENSLLENSHYSYVLEPVPTPRFSIIKSLSLLTVFFTLTPVALTISIFALVFISTTAPKPKEALATNNPNINIFAALPANMPSVEASIGTGDARVDIIKAYLRKYNSPLYPYAEYIVNVADDNDLDFRLITAIAQQESNLCKVIPEGTYNCWGWGIHSRGTLGFSSFEEGIRVVSEGIKRDYIDEGLTTPPEIMSKYTPLSNGSWANGVGLFIEEMQ